jgi:hypothetical protein
MASFHRFEINDVGIRFVKTNESLSYSIHDIIMSLRKCSDASSRQMMIRILKNDPTLNDEMTRVLLKTNSKPTYMVSFAQACLFLKHIKKGKRDLFLLQLEAFDARQGQPTRVRKTTHVGTEERFAPSMSALPVHDSKEPMFENWEDWCRCEV